MEQKPLTWWDVGGTRRAVFIAFVVGLVALLLGLFPKIDEFYHAHPTFKNLIDALVGLSGIVMAFLEWRHSGEANEHRAQLNRLTDEANESRKEANLLGAQRLELQTRVHVLQEEIERKLTKIRLYLRANLEARGGTFLASNLSDFDLWVNQVRLVITDAATTVAGEHVIDGGKRISRGHTEDGFLLFGKILSLHNNQWEGIDIKFYVEVETVGVADLPVTIRSPEYHLKIGQGKRELKVLKWQVG